jgi:hypothetical protein
MKNTILIRFVTRFVTRFARMYYAYIFGCNKYEPVLLLAAKDMELIIDELNRLTNNDLFDIYQIVTELKDMSEDEDVDFIKRALSGDSLAGPAKDYDDISPNSKDWYITKTAGRHLYNTMGVNISEVKCNIPFRLSIFDLRHKDMIDFASILEEINTWIL